MSTDRVTTDDLLRSAIHELKGPISRLRVIGGLLLTRNVTLDEDTKSLLKHIEDSTVALDGVVGGLRRYTELCVRPTQAEAINLTRPIAAATANLREAIATAGAAVSHEALPIVHGDRAQITWLFEELIGNAIRFHSSAPTRVEISAVPKDVASWLISVRDNGTGIESDYAERVFMPFKKLSREGGAGLGLTLCRKIVEMHGGQIWVETRTNGAEIRFVLPGKPK